ncbi:type II toxin-antitoxin system HicA family toxin [Patescibacteria group bacterium]|nr:type II toxin-antitoxin system HicA family toxin [Patescibacteria group bacterium]MBU4368705.1 type II toxin-antitoxin system HicA family toxin [Patescibacteria group bacterium]
MSKKFPVANYRQVVKVARKLGFSFCRQAKGSHEIWRRDSDGRQTTIFNHSSKPIKRKTLKSILENFSITPEEFSRLR